LGGTDVAFFLAENSGEPKKFNEAYNYHPKTDGGVKWRKANKGKGEDRKRKKICKRANGYSR
jgi:hypothetical protein